MANKKDSLGDRMKNYYESIPKTKLMRRTPVIIRIDGKAFHTFTRGFNKPYDVVLSNAMVKTMEELCRNIQGCVFGYTQSDEITLALIDYNTLDTQAWFDYEVQKLCSVSASMATAYFNKFFSDESLQYYRWVYFNDYQIKDRFPKENRYLVPDNERAVDLIGKYQNKVSSAMFDSRCFNIPKEEVCNMFIWRQQDATRNSIEMLGRHYFSPKQLFKKNCSDIQDMLMETHGVNWNNVDTIFKRGCACFKKEMHVNQRGNTSINGEFATTGTIGNIVNSWFVDYSIPIFTQNRDYIEKHIIFE